MSGEMQVAQHIEDADAVMVEETSWNGEWLAKFAERLDKEPAGPGALLQAQVVTEAEKLALE